VGEKLDGVHHSNGYVQDSLLFSLIGHGEASKESERRRKFLPSGREEFMNAVRGFLRSSKYRLLG
jgi:hypothetical protein